MYFKGTVTVIGAQSVLTSSCNPFSCFSKSLWCDYGQVEDKYTVNLKRRIVEDFVQAQIPGDDC